MYPTEDEIIDGCLKGIRSAQKAFYDKYCVAMYSVAYRICSDYDLANDALQDAFLQAFSNIAKFRGDSTLGKWLKTIVVRAAIKKIKKENLFITLNEIEHDISIEMPGPLNSEYLEKAILSLPNGYRTIFLLVEVEGYTHRETAAMLNISEGTSKSQLHHSKKKLQNTIKELIGVEIQQ